MDINKKYEFTGESKHCIETGVRVNRIRAVRDFGVVKAGDIGGWIESEDNLSHDGDCWVYDDAIVCNDARVYGNATISRSAIISDHAKVFDDARVTDLVRIKGNACIFGYAQIYMLAIVGQDACVYGNAKIYDNAWITGKTMVYDNAKVMGNYKILGGGHICGKTLIRNIYEQAKFKDDEIIWEPSMWVIGNPT